METPWDEFGCLNEEFKSPEWHARELSETEQRLAKGEELVLDWEAAKQELRRQSEV